MLKSISTMVGLAAALAAASPALAAFNTALSQAEVDKIMSGHCSRERGYARDAVGRMGEDWTAFASKANSVMLANMDINDVTRLIRRAEAQGSGGNTNERELASFQVCILDAKIAYAETHEKRDAR